MSLSSVETFILRLPRTNTCENFLYGILHVKPVWNEFYQEYCQGNTKIYPGVFGSTKGLHSTLLEMGISLFQACTLLQKSNNRKHQFYFQAGLYPERFCYILASPTPLLPSAVPATYVSIIKPLALPLHL